MARQPILITGGAGYIGSHTLERVLSAGHDAVVVDNLSNADASVIARVEALAGRKVLAFIRADVRDQAVIEAALRDHDCGSVMHFAGLKAVGESMADPLRYYRENVGGAVSLFGAMQACGVEQLVFSSSATVYGEPHFLPYTEDHPLAPTNPYGQTKRMIEDMAKDLYMANPNMRVALLRYFNPCGAHPSGTIGENPRGVPNNLVPFMAQVASGQRPQLNIYGDDYDTPDGTGVRDYIHVVDLAEGHLKALNYLGDHPGCHVFNLGSGQGASVMEVLRAFEKAVGRTLPYEVVARRPGDIACFYADPHQAAEKLGWRVQYDLDAMCADHWRWQKALSDGLISGG